MVSIKIPDFIDRLHGYDLGEGCPVHVAIAALKADKWGRRRIVSGRGETPGKAARRCVFEAIERQAAIFDETRELTFGSQARLEPAAVEAQRLILISERQYARRDEWNKQVGPDHAIPRRFDERRTIAWVRVQSMLTGNERLVPAAACFLGYPRALEDGFPVPDSSGLAFGARRADAIERAFLELVERDAVSIWWYCRLRRPAVEPEPGIAALWKAFADWMRNCGRTFWILDLTHDLGIPVAAAVSCNNEGSDLAFGFAAGRTPAAAARSAMGELVQFEATKRLSRQSKPSSPPGLLAWCASARVDENPFLTPSRDARRAPVSTSAQSAVHPELSKTDGHDVLVAELPHEPENGHVVRVFVPGLRCIWPRFAPGRLYDVPVRLAWRERRLSQSELNPIPILY
ncbi:MAG: YcaO-like family protein [Parvibaculaceae bacterium]